jgi:GDP-L-fucose synthase
VLPALIRKFHDAKINGQPVVTLWGTGKALREFLHVDEMADASLFLLEHYDDGEIVNIGVGEDISIANLADIVKGVVGYDGGVEYDSSKPDGTPRKLVDVTRINGLGWSARIDLRSGIEQTYQWFLDNQSHLRGIA